MRIAALLILTLTITGYSKAQETARNDDWRITPPPTDDEMSHYRIVQNEAKTAYAVQSTNTSWLDEHDWFQMGNTWNTLRECTNDIHEDVRLWRKRAHTENWVPVPFHAIKLMQVTNYMTNDPELVVRQKDNQWKTTNIIIAADFKGTIQIGSNFLTVAKLNDCTENIRYHLNEIMRKLSKPEAVQLEDAFEIGQGFSKGWQACEETYGVKWINTNGWYGWICSRIAGNIPPGFTEEVVATNKFDWVMEDYKTNK